MRKIVVNDGVYVQPQGATTTQTLQGFYKSSPTPSAKITYIAGTGAKNPNERIFFNGTLIATNPFPDSNKSSDRGWANPTFNVSSLMSMDTNQLDYGETATTTIDHTKATPYECLTLGAIMFSTAVKDDDHDGLPDGLEDAAAGLKDPDGVSLPNLYAMGARTGQQDIIVELNAMTARPGTTYGSAAAPFDLTASPPITQLVDSRGHNHLPWPEVIKGLGDILLNSPNHIHAHFDVGPLSAYHALKPYPSFVGVSPYASTEADQYLVDGSEARGGETFTEVACVPDTVNPPRWTCQFPDYPGTLGWMLGYEHYKNQHVANDGTELTTAARKACIDNGTCPRIRFDEKRDGLVHLVTYAHARGKAKSTDPALPDFHAPSAHRASPISLAATSW